MTAERDGAWRRQRLGRSALYFVWTPVPDGDASVVEAALRGGADIVQLRTRRRDDESEVRELGPMVCELCLAHGALFVVNDRADLALELGADGVHVGQGDEPLGAVRSAVGDELLVGISTHTPEQVAKAGSSTADNVSVGPVWATPTKPGRPATGLELVRHASATLEKPWFAIGGIEAGNLAEVAAAGARRVVVVRAIRDAPDPEEAARQLAEPLLAGVG